MALFGPSKRQVEDLEQRLAAGQAQYDRVVQELMRLQSVIAQAGGQQVIDIAAADARFRAESEQLHAGLAQQRAALEAQVAQAQAALASRQANLYGIDREIDARRRALADLDMHIADVAVLNDAGITGYRNPAESSVALGERLKSVRERAKDMVRHKRAVTASTNFMFNNSQSKGRTFVSDMSKMMLRAYNAEAENCVLTVKAGNGESARKRLERAKEQAERLGRMIDLRVDSTYHLLRQEELSLTLAYLNAKAAEKEAEREERARLREERKAQQELQSRRSTLAKERDHYRNVADRLLAQGRDAEAQEALERLGALDKEIEKVDFRAANIRAGYVYVISNIGAFGRRMVKIGMTRRLDPMDRVRELSDASVPFNFDVHALFFSDDAVGVETDLHHRFADKRVNWINPRREFFYATPAEVRDVLTEISGNLLEFIEEPEAEQYRLSLAAAKRPGEVPSTDREHPAFDWDEDDMGEGPQDTPGWKE